MADELPPRLAHLAGREPPVRRVWIYVLLDPADGRPRWVGSSYSPQHRAQQHWDDAREGYTRDNPALYEWLRSLDQPPEYDILAETTEATRWDDEERITVEMSETGHKLLNMYPGHRRIPLEP